MPAIPFVSFRPQNRVQQILDGQYRGDQPLRTLHLLLRGHERKIALAFVLYVVKMSPNFLVPQGTQYVVDALTHPSPRANHLALIWVGVMLASILQNIPTHTAYANLISAAMRDAQRDLRSALVTRLQQLSIAFHTNTESGRLQTKLLRDVDNIGAVIYGVMNSTVPTIVMITYAMVQALRISPVIAVFFLTCVPAACGLGRLFRDKLQSRNQAFRQDMESVSARLSEMIEMVPVTRAHAAEGREVGSVRRKLSRLTASARRMDITTEWFGASAWVTFQAFQLACLCLCAWLVHRHQLTVGQLVMFQAFFGMIVGSVSGTLNLLPQLTSGAESIRSIGEVLESPELESSEGGGTRSLDQLRGEISFEHVGFTYPEAARPAVDNFQLYLRPGECVALVGASGSGKSTIASLAIGFRRPTSGRILIDGVDSAEIDYRSFRRHLAIVPQTTILFSGTVRENITYGMDNIAEAQLQSALDRSGCAEFVGKLPDGLKTRIGPRGGKLSGGQRQRIAIARALLRDPRVLILDEATSALDAESERLVQRAIEELIEGRTTIIIAHRLSTLRAADRIIVLENGRIIEQGSWNELLGREGSAFGRAYALQNEVVPLVVAA